ncbi:hypothetical protein RZN05_02325 [Sphingomonas sp. HF-S4]|uniref:Uncharacterized protein n=1 Tax=Sphingomonas agrestis TaxID=3080540 RepID=A0ABU3Y339_9SPHN|nr:hypothetical protein [Sphingomonas sp. HF-S4]MDV3455805.1 hypothetical protein [Sphingomonas sp. HF-S4]
MTEATRDDPTKTPEIDWRMSASLENVPRGEEELAEVTSLERAVRAWRALDDPHRDVARLTLERPVQLDGALADQFIGAAIAQLVERLPAASQR